MRLFKKKQPDIYTLMIQDAVNRYMARIHQILQDWIIEQYLTEHRTLPIITHE